MVYASTRPFDDPQMLVQTQWEPLVPHVTINLYQEGIAADGVTPTLTLVDTTQTSSWDDWAQGFRRRRRTPNMNCPGQSARRPDLFFFTLLQPAELPRLYNNVAARRAGAPTPLPNNSQFKCYDGMHNWNQIQPAPYDGMYEFPSVTAIDPTTGKPLPAPIARSARPNPDRRPTCTPALPMLPPGKYVVEVVLPPGYELVKEEDKNILIGDNYIAPVTQQFGGLGKSSSFPTRPRWPRARVAGPGYNANNAAEPDPELRRRAEQRHRAGLRARADLAVRRRGAHRAGLHQPVSRRSKQVAPFAGATRNLCDRKEVTLGDQTGAIAKFYVYTSTHIASKFTGGITDDYTSEFDPFSPQFGEKFAPPNLPVSVKDWAGNETIRVYADQWGAYNGMTYSTWEVNPPNPTGYAPTMMVMCMNDPGPIPDTPSGRATDRPVITDPLFTRATASSATSCRSCRRTTQYLDTPVVPTSAFAGAGYNNVDCAYPDCDAGDQGSRWRSESARGSAHRPATR